MQSYILPESPNGCNQRPHGITNCLPARTTRRCAVSGWFRVDGQEKSYKASGEGDTPDEAAANLAATIAATRQALPHVAKSREAQVGVLLARGIACAVRKGDQALLDRLSKAAFLVLSDAVTPTADPDVWSVRSMADAGQAYDVLAGSHACGCPDWQRRHAAGDTTYTCKHGLAVLMMLRLQGAA